MPLQFRDSPPCLLSFFCFFTSFYITVNQHVYNELTGDVHSTDHIPSESLIIFTVYRWPLYIKSGKVLNPKHKSEHPAWYLIVKQWWNCNPVQPWAHANSVTPQYFNTNTNHTSTPPTSVLRLTPELAGIGGIDCLSTWLGSSIGIGMYFRNPEY